MAKAVPIDPGKLLESAVRLATPPGGGAGRPRSVSLRRAVSNSYYALFHCMCRDAAGRLVPNASATDRLGLTRIFGHREMKFVCGQIAEREGVGVNKYVRPIVDHLKSTPLADVAASFCDLQEARHRADYDHTAVFSKAAVAAHINDAQKAIGTIESSDEEDLRELAALLALSARASLS